MHLFVTEMCTYVQISATKWCIVGYGTGALGFMQQVYSRVELTSNFGVTKYSPQVINDVRFQYWFTEKLESSWSQLGRLCWNHYGDVTMRTIASQITSLTIVYSIVYSDADQRKHQGSASLAFVRGIHRGPVNSPRKWPVTRKMFPFDDVIM